MRSDQDVLRELELAFAEQPCPDHFTDFAHCAECAAHDERLQACARAGLALEDVGYAAWDPFCAAVPASFAFFFPALARLALGPPSDDHGWYGTQLLFHLSAARLDNGFFQFCTPGQRAAIGRFIGHLLESRAGLIDANRATDEMLDCYALWIGPAPTPRVLN